MSNPSAINPCMSSGVCNGDDRPTKKLRPSVAPDFVERLAADGCVKHDVGDFSGAEESFFLALSCLDIGSLQGQSENSAEPIRRDVKAIGHNRPSNDSFARDNGSSSTADTRIAASSCESRVEYDEGMRVYSSLLPINTLSQGIEGVSAVLFYNIAQIYVERRKFELALAWFHLSLDIFLSSPRSEYSLCAVKSLHCLGYCLYRLGEDGEAKVFYQRALCLLSELNLTTTRHLAASVNCVGVLVFNKQSLCNSEKAMVMFTHSLQLYRESDDADLACVATVLNNLGRTHFMCSRFKEAITVYKECLRLRRTILGKNSLDVAATLYNMAQSYHQLCLWDEAITQYQEFLRITTVGTGPSMNDAALVYKGMAEIYQQKSDFKMALDCYSQALKLQRGTKDELNTDIASTLNKMGNLCYEMKRFEDAKTHYQESLRVEKAIFKDQPSHPHIIITLTNIGHIHKHLEEYKKALVSYQLVDSMQISSCGVDNFARAETMSSIGLMQYYLHEYVASFDAYQEALRIRRQHCKSDDDLDIASTLNSIGLVLFKQDAFDLSKQCFSESLRIRCKLLGRDHRDVAILWYNIATIHFETGEDDLAIRMYKETLRVERHSLGETHPDVVLTLQHLGQVHQQIGHTEQALEYFKEAASIERKWKQPRHSSLARILNLLGNVYLQLGMTTEMMDCYAEASRIYQAGPDTGVTLVIGGYNFYGLSKTNPPCAPTA